MVNWRNIQLYSRQLWSLVFILKNMTIAEQASNVKQVKKYESGIVSDPKTVRASDSIEQIMHKADDLGFSGFPVVDEQNNLAGIITGRDLRFETDLSKPASALMTTISNYWNICAL